MKVSSLRILSRVRRAVSCLAVAVALIILQQAIWAEDDARLQQAQIAFIRGGNLWLIRADGSDPQQLSTSGKCDHPSWSPDGQYLVFTSENDVWTMRIADRSLTRLTKTGHCTTPTYRPGPGEIWWALIHEKPGDQSFASMCSLSAGATQAGEAFTVPQTDGVVRVTWRRDGGLLAAECRFGDGGANRIYTPQGGPGGSLTPARKEPWPAAGFVEPSWVSWGPTAPDQVAAVKTYYPDRGIEGGAELGMALVVLTERSGQQTTLWQTLGSDSGATEWVGWPSWSPDGSSLVYCQTKVAGAAKTTSIIRVNLKTKQSVTLASDASEPAWRPEAVAMGATGASPDRGYAFVAKWGSEGRGNGQFLVPRGVAVDVVGNVYVVDFGNSRVQKFTSTGHFLSALDSVGRGDGQFEQPVSVAVDPTGCVYVADWDNHCIQKFDKNGTFLTKWGARGTGYDQLWPGNVAADTNGHVYVSIGESILKFTSKGAFLTKWGTYGSGDGQFVGAKCAADSAGNVYVADAHNRVQKFTSNGAFLTKWGSEGSGDGQFSDPNDIAVDAAGNVYVSDSGNHRVQKFTGSGVFLTKWGYEGSGDGQFNKPNGIAVDTTGNVYVTDGSSNYRVQVFAPVSGRTLSPPSSSAAQAPAGTDVHLTSVRISPATTDRTVGDVVLVYSDGSIRQITKTHNCSDPRLAPDGKTVGWTVEEAVYKGTDYNDSALYPARLVIWRNGEIVRDFPDGLVFAWAFRDNGAKVALGCGGRTFTIKRFILRDIATSAVLAQADNPNTVYNAPPAPAWAAGLDE